VAFVLLTSLDVSGGVEDFVASEEWQEIRPGQKVPAGLHYRMNLETGKKEAKLLDPSEADNPNTHNLIATKKDDDGVDEPSSISDENVKAVREKMAKLKLSKDIEQIKFLMANFQNASSVEARVNILDDLDYYMHQIDNARDFVTLKGFEIIVAPSLRTTSDDNVTAMASVLLGSAVQSNSPVKDHVISIGLMDALLSNVAGGGRSVEVRSKTVFALSALLRNNPEGVRAFVAEGGPVKILDSLLVDATDVSTVRTRIKTLSFIAQLWNDNRDVVNPGPDYCRVFDQDSLFQNPDLGRIEVLSEVVKSFEGLCDLSTKPVVGVWLRSAKNLVQQEIDDEEDDQDFLDYLKKIRENLVSVIEKKTEL